MISRMLLVWPRCVCWEYAEAQHRSTKTSPMVDFSTAVFLRILRLDRTFACLPTTRAKPLLYRWPPIIWSLGAASLLAARTLIVPIRIVQGDKENDLDSDVYSCPCPCGDRPRGLRARPFPVR